MVKKIHPTRKICSCGNKVTSHHWLCDECWGARCRIEYRIKETKCLMKPHENNLKKLKEELKKLAIK